MNRLLYAILVLLALDEGFAQFPKPDLDQSPERSRTNTEAGRLPRISKRSQSSFQTMIAYGSFALGDEERFGPMMLLQYSMNRRSMPTIDIVGGVLFRAGASGPVDQREYIPLASHFAYPYSSFGDYYTDPYYQRPLVSFGLAFLGVDFAFYLTEGEVRPYLGVGASFAFWSYSSRFSGTIAPNAKAGLDARISNSFSAFAEVRRMFGVPNLVGPSTPKFDGLTAAAIGVAFAPQIR